ncbi:Phospholipid phosphatase-related protein type 4 [Collichthys lucidus]|uniref:Phospholipid phosphatase-related protein type 4 n=1 Tax=Collichthys lucidus TaxID=240159 RepID=A0A4U5VIP2_COLLU|nr:Phospholipid phosphatase-related protein type 4 [Collichthys lucidus]
MHSVSSPKLFPYKWSFEPDPVYNCAMATSGNQAEDQPPFVLRPSRSRQLPRHLHDFVIDNLGYLNRQHTAQQVIEAHQEESADHTVLTGPEDLRLEGMEARMKDITRQMRQLQSAMDNAKGNAHHQQHPSNLSYPARSSSLPHIHHSGETGLRVSPLLDNQMSWRSANGGYCQLLDHSEHHPSTAKPIQQGELTPTTQAASAPQPSIQVTGPAPEFSQLPAVQLAHHTPLAQRIYSPSLPVQHARQHVQPGHPPAPQGTPTVFLPNQPTAPLTPPPTMYTFQPAQPAPPQSQARPQPFLTTAQQQSYPQYLPILVSSVVSLYFLEWTDVFKPVKSGFTCHDRSLSLPYIDPNHEVIPLLMLLSLAFAGPAITIMIGEAILFCCLSRKKSGVGAEANINAAGCNFNSFIRRAVRFIGVHAFGLCATALITDILQLMTGYPAPYFLTVCKPNYTTLNVSCEQNPYVMEDICSGADPTAINQGRSNSVLSSPHHGQVSTVLDASPRLFEYLALAHQLISRFLRS